MEEMQQLPFLNFAISRYDEIPYTSSKTLAPSCVTEVGSEMFSHCTSETGGGSFNKKVARKFRPYFAITSQKFLAKLVFQLDHFALKLFAHFLYSIIMGVAKWEPDLWWVSLL